MNINPEDPQGETSIYTSAMDFSRENYHTQGVPSSGRQRSAMDYCASQLSTNNQSSASEPSPEPQWTTDQLHIQDYLLVNAYQELPDTYSQNVERDMNYRNQQIAMYGDTGLPNIELPSGPSHQDARTNSVVEPYHITAGPYCNTSSSGHDSQNLRTQNGPWPSHEGNTYGEVYQGFRRHQSDSQFYRTRRTSGLGKSEDYDTWETETQCSYNQSQIDGLHPAEDSQEWPVFEPQEMQPQAQPLLSSYNTYGYFPNAGPLLNITQSDSSVPQSSSLGYAMPDSSNGPKALSVEVKANIDSTRSTLSEHQSSQDITATPDSTLHSKIYGNDDPRHLTQSHTSKSTQDQGKNKPRKGRKLTPLTIDQRTNRAHIRRVGACSDCKVRKISCKHRKPAGSSSSQPLTSSQGNRSSFSNTSRASNSGHRMNLAPLPIGRDQTAGTPIEASSPGFPSPMGTEHNSQGPLTGVGEQFSGNNYVYDGFINPRHPGGQYCQECYSGFCPHHHGTPQR